jgi:hypothetical protein
MLLEEKEYNFLISKEGYENTKSNFKSRQILAARTL